MTTKTEKAAARAEAIDLLRSWLKPGDTVYTMLKHVSSSGMSRDIAVLIVRDGQISNVSCDVARAIGAKIDSKDGTAAVKINGAGMDMGFRIVYALGCALWPDGTPEPHSIRNGRADTNGGYALNHRWI